MQVAMAAIFSYALPRSWDRRLISMGQALGVRISSAPMPRRRIMRSRLAEAGMVSTSG